MTMTEAMACNGGMVRKAADCLVSVTGDPKDLHRSAHNSMVEFNLQGITDGLARGVASIDGFCADKPGFTSPWHSHECDLQIGIVTTGSVEIAYADQEFSRIGPNDIILIPGGTPHFVREASADYGGAEFTFPGTFATTDCQPPAHGARSPAAKLALSDAMRSGEMRGLLLYDYPIGGDHARRYAIGRQRRSRNAPFEQGTLSAGGGLLLLYVTQGTRTVELDGMPSTLESGDLLVLPERSACSDIDASDEHEAVVIRLLDDRPG